MERLIMQVVIADSELSGHPEIGAETDSQIIWVVAVMIVLEVVTAIALPLSVVAMR
jgi:hypothetical protein